MCCAYLIEILMYNIIVVILIVVLFFFNKDLNRFDSSIVQFGLGALMLFFRPVDLPSPANISKIQNASIDT